ncbi:MAG TPA: acyl-CoA dehydrogenase family protein [Acidimicrobiales bacterium]|jgi:alkylation response protein AidB-like acyl-CoA dehydrogenase|nr:acyl-CoA dehydrogenase family protein [Acidimicrobiales bacterium]
MLLALSSDQELFSETTAKLLDEMVPVGELRRLRDDPVGFAPEYWRRGAELGWMSLLVGEDHGGGSIGDFGLVDLCLVAYQFGRHAAPGPLAVTNVVAATLSETGHRDDTIGRLVSGAAMASWCLGEPPPNDRLGNVALQVAVEGEEVVLNGVKRPVESAVGADLLLVTGRSGSGLTQVLVPAGATGLSIAPMDSVDLTRRFSVVTFDEVRLPATAVIGGVGSADEQVDRQVQRAVAIGNAESVGAMQAAFDTTVEWAFDRYSFGRPLASYQELKHRFADMKTWLEASHAVSDAATAAVAGRSPKAWELLSSAKSFIGVYGSELLQDCVQIHGGIGLTFDHDIHLYLRRHTVNRALFGTPADHRQRLTDIAESQEPAP